jgi:hypothetical protein
VRWAAAFCAAPLAAMPAAAELLAVGRAVVRSAATSRVAQLGVLLAAALCRRGAVQGRQRPQRPRLALARRWRHRDRQHPAWPVAPW